MTLSVIVKNSANMTKYFITILFFLFVFSGFSQVDTSKVKTLSWEELRVEQDWYYSVDDSIWEMMPVFTKQHKAFEGKEIVLKGDVGVYFQDTLLTVTYFYHRYIWGTDMSKVIQLRGDFKLPKKPVYIQGTLALWKEGDKYFYFLYEPKIVGYWKREDKRKQKKK